MGFDIWHLQWKYRQSPPVMDLVPTKNENLHFRNESKNPQWTVEIFQFANFAEDVFCANLYLGAEK